MNSTVRIGAAVVAVLVLAVVACSLPPGRATGVGASAATATPTASPIASRPTFPAPTSPAPSATTPWWLGSDDKCGYARTEYGCAGELGSGTHTSAVLAPALTYTVSSGWVNSADWPTYFALWPDTSATRAGLSNDLIVRSVVIVTDDIRVATTDCDRWKREGGTRSAEIAAALAARPGLVTTEPVTVSVGGLTGLQLDVGFEPEWTGTCPQDQTTPTIPLVGTAMAQGDDRHRLILLDKPDGGNMSILLYADHAADFEPFLAAAMPVVDSFTFDMTP